MKYNQSERDYDNIPPNEANKIQKEILKKLKTDQNYIKKLFTPDIMNYIFNDVVDWFYDEDQLKEYDLISVNKMMEMIQFIDINICDKGQIWFTFDLESKRKQYITQLEVIFKYNDNNHKFILHHSDDETLGHFPMIDLFDRCAISLKTFSKQMDFKSKI